MLILTRRVGERLMIGDNIIVKVVRIEESSQVRIGIEAPPDVRIVREEVKDRSDRHRDDRIARGSKP